MHRFAYRARWALMSCAVAAAPLLLGGCGSEVKNSLLALEQPGTITPASAVGATGAMGLRVGAISRFNSYMAGGGNNNESIPMMADLLTDVWKSSDTFLQRNEVDQRTVETNNANIAGEYTTTQQARGNARDAILAFAAAAPDSSNYIAQMWFNMGYTEMMLGEVFCNGIPLGITTNGVPTYTQPLTDAQVFAVALTHLDSAIAIANGTDAFSVQIKNAATVAAARTLIDLGQFTQATALSASVPTSFQYVITFTATTTNNEVWTEGNSVNRYTVGDSFDLSGTIGNAIPFASAHDPRVPVTGCTAPGTASCTTPTKLKPEDNSTPYVGQLIWAQDDPYPVATGLDARLIDAEAALNAGNIAGTMTILNALRAAPPTQGIFTPTAMAALPTPGTQAAAVALFFREKAFWQWGRGMRLGDMRRMLRQYAAFYPSQTNVFPTGTFFKGGTYGTSVNLPVTTNEQSNPNFKQCIDNNP
jgi:starch-binding outer membrane protein, SusD/RagB family